jgi:hypothetical protein
MTPSAAISPGELLGLRWPTLPWRVETPEYYEPRSVVPLNWAIVTRCPVGQWHQFKRELGKANITVLMGDTDSDSPVVELLVPEVDLERAQIIIKANQRPPR